MRAAVLQMAALSFWGGAATLLVFAFCAVLRRLHAPARLLKWLWLPAAVRFCCPFAIPVFLPAAPILPSAPAPLEFLPQAAQPLAGAVLAAPQAGPAPPPDVSFPWSALALLWLGGALLLLARAGWASFCLHRRVALACKTPDGAFTCSAVTTPFVLGLPPRIYLPEALTGADRSAVLLHERTHVSRGDFLLKPLYYAVACLHWWNPLAWLAFAQFCRELEASCDEAAARTLDAAGRSAYCESLYRFAVSGRTAPAALAFGAGSLKERVTRVLHAKRPGKAVLLLCAITLACTTAACAVRPALPPAIPVESASVQEKSTESDTSQPAEESFSEPPAAELPEQSASSEHPVFIPSFLFPLDLSDYNYCSHHLNDYHNGCDYSAPNGSPVYAAAPGTVTVAGYHYSYGNYVILSHGFSADGNEWRTLYAHMATLSVAAGDTVDSTTQLGTVGCTGTATGNHLHIELFLGADRLHFCDCMNGLSSVRPAPIQLISSPAL